MGEPLSALLPRTIGPDHAGLRMSGEQFDAHEDWVEGHTYELVDGRLTVGPHPEAGVRGAMDFLGWRLRTHIDAHPDGPAVETLYMQYVAVPDGRLRADRAVWTRPGFEHPDRTVPALVIDIVSRDWRDHDRRRRDFAAAGVRECWTFDRFARTATVDRDGSAFSLGVADVVATPLIPGFELPVADVLREAGRFG